MSLVAKQTGSDRVPAPAGTHLAICYGLFDLGTQTDTFSGRTTVARKVRIVWELCQEKLADGKPFSVGVFYTNSLHEKATLRKHLEAWRGRSFTPDELKGFNLVNILGKPCMLNIAHKEKDGKVYENVTAIMAAPKGTTVPTQVNKNLSFDIDSWDQKIYDEFPDFLKVKIAKSPEGAAKLGGGPAPTGGKPADPVGDEIPF